MMKKTICIILIIILSITSFPIISSASNSDDFYCQYSGSTTASYGYKPNCTFTITQIVGDKFRGSFVATNLGSYNLSKQVEGTIYRHDYSFTCQFSIPEFYNTWFSILVHPYQGYCQCVTAGNWHFEDFEMTGTRFSFSNDEESILDDNLNIDDVKLCMNLSYFSYDVKSDRKIPDTLNSELDNLVGYDNDSLEMHNYSKKQIQTM
ncbi:MAG: hypothetical protein ACI4XC_05735 [Eubacterium sp.]